MKIVVGFREWLFTSMKSVMAFFSGLYLFMMIPVSGIVSLSVYVISVINGFARREPIAMAIFSFIIFFLSLGWMTTFVSESKAKATAEYQRDSLSYEIVRMADTFNVELPN